MSTRAEKYSDKGILLLVLLVLVDASNHAKGVS